MRNPLATADPDNLHPGAIPPRRLRRPAVTAAAVAAAMLAAAVVVSTSDAAASSASGHDAHAARTTVREFLTSAVVDRQTYAGCRFLTPAQQATVGALTGASATCTQTLSASPGGLFGIGTNDGVAHLGLRAAVHGARATVTATKPGRTPFTSQLTRTTPEELGTFQAPRAGWRIAGGATRLFGSGPTVGSSTAALG